MDIFGNAPRFLATGQSLMHHAMREGKHPAVLSLVETIQAADVAFTNYEGSLRPDEAEVPPNRHPSPPHTLHDLRWMGFNLLSLANNHAAEVGDPGITHTKAYATQLGFATAGTGVTLEEATGAVFLQVGDTRVALIAIDSVDHRSKEVIAGQDGQPGVNALRGEWVDGVMRLHEDDVIRNLRAIEEAAKHSDYVFVSLHEHFWLVEWREIAFLESWPSVWKEALPWKRDLTRQFIDAGAAAVLCHGLPRFCAIEMYRGRPIFHSLGNFIFHLPNSVWWPHPEVWEGAMVEAMLADATMKALRLIPFALVDADGREDVPSETRIYPARVTGARATAIFQRIADESTALGTNMRIDDDDGLVALA